MLKSLDSIIHNVHDHAKTILDSFDDTMLKGDARDRMRAHIAAEEVENQKVLMRELEAAPKEDRHRVRVALDHSKFLVDIIRGEEISPEVSREVLHHMIEEFQEGYLGDPKGDENSAPATPPVTTPEGTAPAGPQWTVGSLIGRR